MSRPSPRDLAARPHRPLTARPVSVPVPGTGAVPTPPPPAPVAGWDRLQFERAVRSSPQHPAGLLPYARLVAFLLTHFADPAGHIPARRVPAVAHLARAAGITDRRALSALNALEDGGWLKRHRRPAPNGARGGLSAITLTIPAARQPTR
ncbi:hypothetical protein ACWEFL_15890 [Streptomyces sp. NPDC004838]